MTTRKEKIEKKEIKKNRKGERERDKTIIKKREKESKKV